jgi:aspartate kinase
VTAKKMKIGGIMASQNLGMITVEGAPDAPGIAGKILEAIGNLEISVGFISCAPDLGGGASITFCVAMDRFEKALEEIERVREEIQAQKVATQEEICSVAVFGPHFGEIPNVASRIFRALAEAGINILAISTSVSSVTCVFDQKRLNEGVASLRSHFDIP